MIILPEKCLPEGTFRGQFEMKKSKILLYDQHNPFSMLKASKYACVKCILSLSNIAKFPPYLASHFSQCFAKS